jgi:LuxR family transcriptional regulator of spore coat protein
MAVDVVIPDPVTRCSAAQLSRRELVVLSNLGRGLTLEEVAACLFVSRNTVKTQVRSLYRKLGVSTRADAVARLSSQPEPRPAAARLRAAAASRAHDRLDASVAGPPSGETSRVTRLEDLTHYRPHLAGDPASTAGPTISGGTSACPPRRSLAELAERRGHVEHLLHTVEAQIAQQVAADLAGGAAWTEVAAALGMSRQAARRRFGVGVGVAADDAVEPAAGAPAAGDPHRTDVVAPR